MKKASYWNDFFKKQNNITNHENNDWLSSYKDFFTKNKKVLDLGCGNGNNINFILNYTPEIIAADFSLEALKIVNHKFDNVETISFDMTDTFPFDEDTFDVIVADLSLHYFSWSDTKKIISEISRTLKNKGILIARVHSIKDVVSSEKILIEENYYFVNEYSRRFFDLKNIKQLFIGWKFITMVEKEIIKFNTQKNIIEFAVENNK